MKQYDVIIVGGGLAGLTAALHLMQEGAYKVLVIEKDPYPRHRVCGEYLSREVLPYLQSLGIYPEGAKTINILQLSAPNGRFVEAPLPLGGIGISRYALDALLYHKARQQGVSFVFDSVLRISKRQSIFTVTTSADTYYGRVVVGAYGKRAALDKELGRSFIDRKSPWLAVKAHYEHPDWPDAMVGLHSFHGGYGGLSRTETGQVNFCYLATYKSFKKAGSIADYNANIVSGNPILADFLSRATMVYSEPLSIAQISFQKKHAVENELLMCGDSAGLIHPLCGNGMAMAIHSAKLASEGIHRFFSQNAVSHASLTADYQQRWDATFRRRLAVGRGLQTLLLQPKLAAALVASVARTPFVLRTIIRNTHGKPIPL